MPTLRLSIGGYPWWRRKFFLSDFNDQMCERVNSLVDHIIPVCYQIWCPLTRQDVYIADTKKLKSMNILSTFELSWAYLTFLPSPISLSLYCWKISNLLFFRRSLSFTWCWLFAFQLIFFLNIFIDRHLFVDSVDNDDQHQRTSDLFFLALSLLLHISQMSANIHMKRSPLEQMTMNRLFTMIIFDR